MYKSDESLETKEFDFEVYNFYFVGLHLLRSRDPPDPSFSYL